MYINNKNRIQAAFKEQGIAKSSMERSELKVNSRDK